MLKNIKNTYTYGSIKEAPEVLAKVLEEKNKIREIADKIKKINPKYIFFAGSGSSFDVSKYGEILFNNFIDVPVAAKTSLDYTNYTPGATKKTVTVVISVSGSKGDATAIAKKAKQNGSFVFSIVNTPNSPLEKLSDVSYFVNSGKSKSFINTTAYVAQLFVVALFADFLSNRKITSLESLPKKIKETFGLENKIKQIAQNDKQRKVFVFTGKGPSKVIADQTAIKLRETAWDIKHSESIPIDEIPHGRLFSLGDKETLFIPMIAGQKGKKKAEDIVDLLEGTGAKVLSFASPEYKLKNQITLPKMNEFLFPILAQPIAYIFVFYMNIFKGFNIDEPRNVKRIDTFLRK